MKSIVADGKKHTLFIPEQTLQGYGCRNCVWKTYGQCPHKYTKQEESVTNGYCMELANFILALAGPGDSISAVEEKFFIYTQKMQAMADGSEYQVHLQKYKDFKETKPEAFDTTEDEKEFKKKLFALEADMVSFKIWWSRLTDSVIKNLSMIADRESRKQETRGEQKITIQQLNVLLKQSDKVLEDSNGN